MVYDCYGIRSWTSLNRFNGNNPLEVLRNIKRAFTLLHEGFFVHGDLRPNNILVNPNGDIRVVDFEYSGRYDGTTPVCYPPFLNKKNFMVLHGHQELNVVVNFTGT
jgi:serine/threonine protein kinase